MARERLIAIGEVATSHGVRGEVKVLPLTDFRERFRGLERVFAVQGEKVTTLHVEGVRYTQEFVLLKFREIKDRTQAQGLRGAVLKVKEEEVFPLPPGFYYVFQLLGLAVYTLEGDYLGELREVISTGSNDVYVVFNAARQEEILLPALKEVVREIDLGQGRMHVKLLPGLSPVKVPRRRPWKSSF